MFELQSASDQKGRLILTRTSAFACKLSHVCTHRKMLTSRGVLPARGNTELESSILSAGTQRAHFTTAHARPIQPTAKKDDFADISPRRIGISPPCPARTQERAHARRACARERPESIRSDSEMAQGRSFAAPRGARRPVAGHRRARRPANVPARVSRPACPGHRRAADSE